MMSRKFTFFPIATLTMVLAFSILIGLGNWQLHRRAWKLELISTIEARSNNAPAPLAQILENHNADKDVRYTKVMVTGRFDHDNEVHVFGTLGPTPGYYIFTPLITSQIALRQPIYINRGFVPQALKDPAKRALGQITEIVTLTGLFRNAERRTGIASLFTPQDLPDANQWYSRDPDLFTKYYYGSSEEGHNWYIDSLGTENPVAIPQGNTTRIDFNNRHLEYALTWFGLALTLVGVWFAYSLRKTD